MEWSSVVGLEEGAELPSGGVERGRSPRRGQRGEAAHFEDLLALVMTTFLLQSAHSFKLFQWLSHKTEVMLLLHVTESDRRAGNWHLRTSSRQIHVCLKLSWQAFINESLLIAHFFPERIWENILKALKMGLKQRKTGDGGSQCKLLTFVIAEDTIWLWAPWWPKQKVRPFTF